MTTKKRRKCDHCGKRLMCHYVPEWRGWYCDYSGGDEN